MAVKPLMEPKSMLIDKRALQRAVAELNERMGFIKDPTATAQKARDMMLAQGVRPEDRILSSEIIRARYEDEE